MSHKARHGAPALVAILALFCAMPALAHVGSKDVYQRVNAGPYELFVTIRPPTVIPGVATVDVESTGELSALRVASLPLTGEASRFAPAMSPMQQDVADAHHFTGAVWLMSSGSWQVRFAVAGSQGDATASIPVPATPLLLLPMQRGLSVLLAVLALLLAVGLGAILAAAVREARLPAATAPNATQKRHGTLAFAAGLTLALLLFVGGKLWWRASATQYAQGLYEPDRLLARLDGNTLTLRIAAARENDAVHRAMTDNDLLLDHGKPMHLYAIRMPQMDAAFHLHPTLVSGWTFREQLPAMPPGTYKLFADIVHRNGFPETPTATITIPANIAATPLAADDAASTPTPLAATPLGATYKLPDGYRMVWNKPALLTANTGYLFRFTLLDPAGRPASDMQPYLGMAGHAAFVKADGSAFAHTHPDGSVAMPAFMLANPGSMAMPSPPEPTVSFPYGFPAPGRYRIFVQLKHGSTVETGVFDADVR